MERFNDTQPAPLASFVDSDHFSMGQSNRQRRGEGICRGARPVTPWGVGAGADATIGTMIAKNASGVQTVK